MNHAIFHYSAKKTSIQTLNKSFALDWLFLFSADDCEGLPRVSMLSKREKRKKKISLFLQRVSLNSWRVHRKSFLVFSETLGKLNTKQLFIYLLYWKSNTLLKIAQFHSFTTKKKGRLKLECLGKIKVLWICATKRLQGVAAITIRTGVCVVSMTQSNHTLFFTPFLFYFLSFIIYYYYFNLFINS